MPDPSLVRVGRLHIPVGRNVADQDVLQQSRAVHQPHRDIAGGVLTPEDVTLAIAVEVAGAIDRPGRRNVADEEVMAFTKPQTAPAEKLFPQKPKRAVLPSADMATLPLTTLSVGIKLPPFLVHALPLRV